MRRLTLALALCAAGVTNAATLELYEEKGCLQKETHSKRLLWTMIAVEATQRRDAGNLNPELAAAGDQALKSIAEVTRSDCRTLNGDYRVLERSTGVNGLKLNRVRVSAKESLWVVVD